MFSLSAYRNLALIIFSVGFASGQISLGDIAALLSVSGGEWADDVPLALLTTAMALILMLLDVLDGQLPNPLDANIKVIVAALTGVLIYETLLRSTLNISMRNPNTTELLLPLQALVGALLFRDMRCVAIGSTVLFVTSIVAIGVFYFGAEGQAILTSFTASRLSVIAAVIALSVPLLQRRGKYQVYFAFFVSAALFGLAVGTGSRFTVLGLGLSLILIGLFAALRKTYAVFGVVALVVIVGTSAGFVVSERASMRILNYEQFLIEQHNWSSARKDMRPSATGRECVMEARKVAREKGVEITEESLTIGCSRVLSIEDKDDRLRLIQAAVTGGSIVGAPQTEFALLAVRPGGQFTLYDSPHNILLEAWFRTGIVGVILISLYILVVLARCIDILAYRDIGWSALVIVPIFIVTGAMFGGDLYDTRWTIGALWVLTALRRDKWVETSGNEPLPVQKKKDHTGR